MIFHSSGVIAGGLMLPFLEYGYINGADTGRDTALRHFHEKYKSIENFNSVFQANLNYFEEIPGVSEDIPQDGLFLNPFFISEYFNAIGGDFDFSLSGLVDNSSTDLAVISNNVFDSYLRTRNSFYPLNLELILEMGAREDSILKDISPEDLWNFVIYRNILDHLVEKKADFHFSGSDILLEELNRYKMVLLSSDFLLTEDLLLRLKKYLNSGGILLTIHHESSLSNSSIEELCSSSELKMDLNENVFIELHSLGEGKHLVIKPSESHNFFADDFKFDLTKLVENVFELNLAEQSDLLTKKQKVVKALKEKSDKAKDVTSITFLNKELKRKHGLSKANLAIDLKKFRLLLINVFKDEKQKKRFSTMSEDQVFEELLKTKIVKWK